MAIKVERKGDFIIFRNRGLAFYDIHVIRLEMSRLEDKQWFTPQVKAQVEALLDV